jgi:hypothetical protein
MSIKVSELTASSGITSDDLFLTTNDPGGTPQSRKATAQQILDYITGSTFDTLTVTNLTGTNSELTGSFSGTFVGDGSALTGIIIPVDNFTLGSTNIILGTTASVIQGLSVITGSTVTGSTALFDNITSSVALFTGDIRVLGTASITQLNTLNQTSLVIGDKYITILSGGIDHTGINGAGFLWGTSSGPGETTGALGEHAHVLYDASRDALEIFPGLYVTGSTTVFGISGTTAQFTTVSASNLTVSGGNVVFYEAAVLGDNAYILYNSGIDKLAAFPGLYVTGAITASTVINSPTGIFTTLTGSTVTGSTALFTTITGSNITGSTARFTAVTASFSGSGANITNITASNINGFQNDVRAQFSAGTNITIVGGTISSTGGGGTPGGTNTTIQFNSGSAFSGSTRLSWDYVANTLFVSGSTNISGTLTATAKSFDIAHPTRDGMRLRYGSLEGPENGVYVRGRTQEKVVQLPDYWTGLVDENTITVNLTPVGTKQDIWVDKVENNTLYIAGDLVDCYFSVFAERKDIGKLLVEY